MFAHFSGVQTRSLSNDLNLVLRGEQNFTWIARKHRRRRWQQQQPRNNSKKEGQGSHKNSMNISMNIIQTLRQ